MKNPVIIAVTSWILSWAVSFGMSGLDIGAWAKINWLPMLITFAAIFGISVSTSSTRVTGKNLGSDRHEVKET